MEKQRAVVKAAIAGVALTAISLAAVSFTSAAHAQSSEPVIVFNISTPNGGAVSYAGGNSPLLGTSINVDSVVGVGTPTNDGTTLSCVGCTLSFATGSCVGNCNVGNSNLMFQSGPSTSLSITGDVGMAAANTVPVTTLFAGSFVDTPSLVTLRANFRFVGAAVTGTLASVLADFYGVPVTNDGGLNLSFAATTTRPPAQNIRRKTASVAGLQSTALYGGDVSLVPAAQ